MTFRQRLFRTGVACLLALVSLGWGPTAGAADLGPTPEAPGVDEALILKARQGGPVRVIVEVRADFTPEGALEGPAFVAVQRAAIARAQAEVERALQSTGAGPAHKYATIPYMALTVNAAALDALRRSPWVVSVAEDVPEMLALAESTGVIGASTPTTGVWDLGFTGAGQTIVVLDSGVDKNHPFLAGKVVAEACFSNANGDGSLFGGQSLCPNGQPQDFSPGAGQPCTLGSCGHGTHVAGIAAGKDYAGGPGFSGVAPEAKIIAIQVFTQFGSAIGTYPSDQLKAMEHVYNTLRLSHTIAAVNLSLGGTANYTSACDGTSADQGRNAAFGQLRSVGIAPVVAAGNNSFASGLAAPACLSNAISVGSTRDGGPGATPVDTVSSFSNSASFLSLLAPGEEIQSSLPSGNFGSLQGTSMAAPHIAGAWAVLEQANPGASVNEVLALLQGTGVPVTDTRNGLTKPRLQLDAALSAYLPRIAESPSVALGRTVLDLTNRRTLNVQNPSGLAMTLSGPGLTGTALSYLGGAFPGTGGTCSTSTPLAGGGACTVELAYAPTSLGVLNGSFSVNYTLAGVGTPGALSVALTGSGVELCTDNLIDNAVFEKPGVAWAQTDSVGGQALPVVCTTGLCGGGSFAPAGPLSGLGWAWFGGYTTTLTTTVTQVLTQSVMVPTGTASLQFQFNISRADPGAGITDTFQALIDATPVFTATALDRPAYAAYQTVRLDANAFATGVTRTVTFSATTTTTGPVVNFNLDDVAMCSPAFYPAYLPVISQESGP